MLSTRFRQYAGDISRTHTSFMACSNILALVGCLSETLFFKMVQRFSIGFRSGLFPGQSKMLIFWAFRNWVTILARWHGAPFCINTLHLWTAICNSNLFFNKSRYFWPFMVVPGGKKKSPAVPFIDIPPKSWHRGGVPWFEWYIFHWIFFLMVSGRSAFDWWAAAR